MNGLENRLAAIGFRMTAEAGECWRVERVGAPLPAPAAGFEQGCGTALSGWLTLLRADPRPQAYRLGRVAGAR